MTDMGKKNRPMNTDPLAKLTAGSDEAEDTQPDAPATGDVWLIYAGKLGPEGGHFDHEGAKVVMMGGEEPFVLRPALNKKSAALFAAYEDHPAIAALRDPSNTQLFVTDAELTGWTSAGRRRQLLGLISNATALDVDALEHLVAMEKARPMVGGRETRRDVAALAKLERTLAAHVRRRPLDLSDLNEQAADLASSHRKAG